MRGLLRRWLLREIDVSATGATGLDVPPLLARILAARGLEDDDSVRRFCDPKLSHLHDPGLLPGCDAAAALIVDAIRAERPLTIYGDYDVDGITATAILYHVVRAVAPGAPVNTYVPHRLDEGYGLNADALAQLARDGAEVVVSVDCGITAVEPARAARAAGLDLVITDHHHLPAGGAPLPDAMLVHPGLPGSVYPFRELCGAGVAFKLAWRIATHWSGSTRVGERLQRTLLDLLPLAALGTIADVVPLVGENRVIASYGLRLMRATPIAGLRALIEASDLMGDHIDSDKVGFVLAPRLNACGRMGHAAEAIHMLTDASDDEAAATARRLAGLNRDRQQTERAILDEALHRAETAGMTADDCRAIVLADPGWHPGVLGIVCSRLVDRFGRPAVLLQQSGDTCRGSARSIEGYSIHDGLAACADHLLTFGGHEAAAGLSLESSRLDDFTTALIAHANAHIDVERLTPAITIDCDAWLDELDLGTVRRIMTLSPFGRDNRRPSLRVRGATLIEPPRPVGAGGKHVALRLRQDHDGRRRVIRAMWWRGAAVADGLVAGMPLDVVIAPTLNTWNGRVDVEAEVRDVCPVEVRTSGPAPV